MNRAELEALVEREATRIGVPVEIAKALVGAESGWDPGAVSRAGARGVMQFMPRTAAGLGIDPMDPEQAIPAGLRYLRQQYDRFGTWPYALAAYNAGPGNAARALGSWPETQDYVERVTAAARWREAGPPGPAPAPQTQTQAQAEAQPAGPIQPSLTEILGAFRPPPQARMDDLMQLYQLLSLLRAPAPPVFGQRGG